MYAKSTQKRNWTFEADELINLRVKHNQEYIVQNGSGMDVSNSCENLAYNFKY